MTTAWRQKRTDRFRILHRDQFACRYCGARPGSELLEVDHLVPRSRGGSDHHSNLVAACKTCNGRKSDTIFFPHDLIERADEEDGWFVHKTYGKWSIVFCEDAIGIQKHRYGFLDGWRVFDGQLICHMYDKCWTSAVFSDMEKAVAHMRQMLCDPRDQGGQDGPHAG